MQTNSMSQITSNQSISIKSNNKIQPSSMTILNKSFYNQKVFANTNNKNNNNQKDQLNNQQQYKSIQVLIDNYLKLQFLKDYYQRNSIQQTITQSIKEVIGGGNLPKNPYCGLLREMSIKSVRENLENQTIIAGRVNNNIAMLGSNSSNTMGNNKMPKSAQKISQQQQQHYQQAPTLTQPTRFQSKQYHLPGRLMRYIDMEIVHKLWMMIQSRPRVMKVEESLRRNKLMDQYFASVGGGVMLNMAGSKSSMSNTSPSSSYQQLQVNYYIQSSSPTSPTTTTYEQSIQQFTQFIIDDTINEMQSHSLSAEINIVLNKLVVSKSQVDNAIQWGIEQLVYDRLKISKQIAKYMISSQGGGAEVYSLSYLLLTKGDGEMFAGNMVRLKKTYVFINHQPQARPSTAQSYKSNNSNHNININSNNNKTNNNLISSYNNISDNQNNTNTNNPHTNNTPTNDKKLFHPYVLTPMFEHVFVKTTYYQFLDQEYRLSEMQDGEIVERYKRELVGRLMRYRREEGVERVAKELMYLVVYGDGNGSTNSNNRRLLASLLTQISQLLSTPYCAAHQTLHSALIHLMNPINTNQQQFYNLLHQAYDLVYRQQLNGDHLMYGTGIVYNSIRMLLSRVLLNKDRNINGNNSLIINRSQYINSPSKSLINPNDPNTHIQKQTISRILNLILTLLNALKQNYLTIVYSMSESIEIYLNTIISQLNSNYGNNNSLSKNNKNNVNDKAKKNTEENSIKMISLSEFYSIKHPPSMVLNLDKHTKDYKSQLQTNQTLMEQMILAKYIHQQQLYSIVYNYHWDLIQFKKLKYPLSKFIQTIKGRAILNQIKIVKKEMERLAGNKNINSNNGLRPTTINQLTIYQLSNSQCIFYSLKKTSLDESILPEYNKSYQKFLPYFTLQQQPTLKQMARYILSLQPIPALSPLAQEHSSMQVFKIHADLLVRAYCSINQVYNLLYTIVGQFMRQADHDGMGVVGIFSSSAGQGSNYLKQQQQRISSWSIQQTSDFLRFDYKKLLSQLTFMKWLQRCLSNPMSNKQLWINLVYMESNMAHSCWVGFNVYFSRHGGEGLDGLFSGGIRNREGQEGRVFANSRELVEYQGLRRRMEERLGVGMVGSDSVSITDNMTIQDMLLYDEDHNDNANNNSQLLKKTIPLTPTIIRTLSPFYSHLQQSLNQITTFLHLITFTKADRRQRFPLKIFIDQFSLLEYYLIVILQLLQKKDQCLLKYEFIYYEGICVEIRNLVSVVNEFLHRRQDNLGLEGEILWLQRVVVRLSDKVKTIMATILLEMKQVIKKEMTITIQ